MKKLLFYFLQCHTEIKYDALKTTDTQRKKFFKNDALFKKTNMLHSDTMLVVFRLF